jgi:hypothetical protein
MSGVAKTLDKIEENAVKNPLADPGVRSAGKLKQKYGDKRGVDTSEGYAQGKEDKEIAAAEAANVAAAQAAEEARQAARNIPKADDDASKTAAKKAYANQRRRSGRMSTILTEDALG